jgi:hypothetical protein
MDESLDNFLSYCGFKTVSLMKVNEDLKVSEENLLKLMSDVRKQLSKYQDFFSAVVRRDTHTVLMIRKFMSIILYVVNKIRSVLDLENTKRKSVSGFWLLKHETQKEIRKDASKVVSILKQKQVINFICYPTGY